MAFHETRILISVVIPVFNAAPYLRRCVDSLLAQTCQDFELILVDDGSTDGSAEMCDEYEAESDRRGKAHVRTLHQENAGVSAARNHGIEVAQGDYISFVDADDWVEPGFLEAFAREIESNRQEGREVDMVVQGYWNHEGKEMQVPYAFYGTPGEVSSELYRLEGKRLVGYVWNKVFRRASLEEHHVRFNPEIPIGEDFVFSMAFLSHTASMAVVPYVGYHYFYPPDNHKNYPFEAWNRRLEAVAKILPTMKAMPKTIADKIWAREFKLSLYVLRVLYHEEHPKAERMAFLTHVKTLGKGNPAIRLRGYEASFMMLGMVVLYLPCAIADGVLTTIRNFR